MAIQLLHHWDFHENTGATVADVVGANNGTASTSAGFTWTDTVDGTNLAWVSGRNSGYAMQCNGQTGNDYDMVYTTDQVVAGGIGSFAIAIWAKQASSYHGVLIALDPDQRDFGDMASGNAVSYQYSSGTNKFYLVFGGPDGTIDIEANIYDGNWHHIVCAWCGGVGRIYLDNTKIKEASLAEFTGAGYWRMFGTKTATPYGTNLSWAGVLDDVKIYSGCITDCEVGKLYNDLDPALCNATSNALMFSCNT
jgi:hypothetical protein